jgi:sugar phosphate isomerase/epimerase
MPDTARLGLMLYTVRDECARDFPATLREVAAIGFEGVELFDLHGCTAAKIGGVLDETGLVACGRHAPLETIESALPDLAAEAGELGWRRLVVSWVDPGQLDDPLVRRLEEAADAATSHGLELGFHNHDAEVRPLDGGGTFLDRLLEGKKLFLELDLGWAWYAGVDPTTLLGSARGRCPLVHVKDFGSREGRAFVPVGDGAVGYERVVPAVVEAAVEWLLVEQDETDGPSLEAARRSLAALETMLELAV